jgi:four helix bundle protein
MISQLKNKNRGYRKLEVWKKAIELYVMISRQAYLIKGNPYKVINQLIGSAYSIHANIAEGYCRRSLNEYLYHLNVALGSLGELGSGLQACFMASQLSDTSFNQLDSLHYEIENKLIKLIESLQRKQIEGEWNDTFFQNEV